MFFLNLVLVLPLTKCIDEGSLGSKVGRYLVSGNGRGFVSGTTCETIPTVLNQPTVCSKRSHDIYRISMRLSQYSISRRSTSHGQGENPS